ncbi:methyl-accepting chemotaxis protein [Pseudoalteromonas luteoviolacea B = ATCC 29581]|nr:methyl-accepting chemotaxis protein [Pseudoalteromonas luteoviolacea B = ATCC 29581]
MNHLLRLFSRHLNLLVLTPCVFLVVLVVNNATTSFQSSSEAAQIKRYVGLGDAALALVHEVQKERGMTAGYLGSNGTNFRSDLVHQQSLVDAAKQRLDAIAASIKIDRQTAHELDEIDSKFNEIARVRSNVKNLSFDLADALGFYTSITRLGLKTVMDLSSLSSNKTLSFELASIYYFSDAKEYAGIERAVLSNVFAKDEISLPLRQRFNSLVNAQNRSIDSAMLHAMGDVKVLFNSTRENKAYKAVLPYRELVDAKDRQFNTPADQWFDAATKRIDLLRDTESQALALVSNEAQTLANDLLAKMWLQLALLAIAVTVTFGVWRTMSLQRKQSELTKEVIRKVIEQKELTQNVDVISDDQLGVIAGYVNELLRQLTNDLAGFQHASARIATATHETAFAIVDSQKNLKEQQTGIDSISSATLQMTHSINGVTSAMQSNFEVLGTVVRECETGEEQVKQTATVVQTLSNKMTDAANKISTLNTEVEKITAVVEIIRGIAEQTNLLALNAAIEAARAGEQGRGFAVVADEVRSLASRTQGCTQQIAKMVVELQSTASESNSTIMSCKSDATTAVDAINSVKQILQNMVRQAVTVEERSREVNENAQAQNAALQEIVARIESIHEKAIANVVGAEQIAGSASDIADSAMKMDELIEQYRVSIQRAAEDVYGKELKLYKLG